MDRRQFVASGAVMGVVGTTAIRSIARAAERTPTRRRAEVTTAIDVSAHEGSVETWVPIIEAVRPYQIASEPRIACSGQAEVVRDDHYGARMVRARWFGAGAKTLTISQAVETRDRGPVKASLSESERRFWLQPTASVPIDGIVRERASARDRWRQDGAQG